MIEWIIQFADTLLIGALAGSALVTIVFSLLLARKSRDLAQAQSNQAISEKELEFKQQQWLELNQQHQELELLYQDSQAQLQLQQNQCASLTAELKQIANLKQNLQARETQLDQLRQQLSDSETKFAQLQARTSANEKHQQEQIQMLNDNKEQLKKEFSHLANEIFEQKQQRFSEQSQQSMTALLEPFNQQIQQFRKRVDDIHTQDAEGRSQLLTQLGMLKDMNSQLNKQADDLTKALKGDKKVQGNWGELQIERILESSGLQKGREYEREENFKDDAGKNFRPDFTIHLPDGKHIIIDSKVSLNAYQTAVASEDDIERELAIKEHVAAVRHHIRSLSQKNYPKLEGMKAPDFVLMFMPIESAFVAAFEAEPNLFNEGFEQHIVVVTPTTLLATLRTVANIWVLERQNENAKELFKLAGKIFDKFVIFSEKMERLGNQLGTADKTYHEAMNSLSDGRGSMVSYVKRLKEVGAPSNKKIPESLDRNDLLEAAED